MLVAHLPSGYVLARIWPSAPPLATGAALIGSVFPDFALIFFYFIDDRAFHHHRYWVHVPAFWAVTAAMVLPLIAWIARPFLGTAMIFFAAILLHLVLDTIAGGIMWAAPFSTELFVLVEVPSQYPNWIMSFLFHWTFLLEIVVWVEATWLFLSERFRPVRCAE